MPALNFVERRATNRVAGYGKKNNRPRGIEPALSAAKLEPPQWYPPRAHGYCSFALHWSGHKHIKDQVVFNDIHKIG